MLKELETNKNVLINEIQRLPISMKTLSIQRRRDEIDEQIRAIEKNIDLFSRKKVYVAL